MKINMPKFVQIKRHPFGKDFSFKIMKWNTDMLIHGLETQLCLYLTSSKGNVYKELSTFI